MPESPADARLLAAEQWIRQVLGTDRFELTPISGDASFRRYFRVHAEGQAPLVLMDAPPDAEDSAPFLDVAARLRNAGLRAPQVHHFDLDEGFGVIEDFGDELYREMISPDSVDLIFPQLFGVLVKMASQVSAKGLPPYDEALLGQELDLFTDWYLAVHRKRALNHAERQLWNSVRQALILNAREQPRVFVHRDFHSCNLLHQPGQPPAIIDFQDAVVGPMSYDFISLIWDRYIHWPREQIVEWMENIRIGLGGNIDQERWVRYCDLMGLQRNLKIVGIFARLRHRNGKQGYTEMIPVFYRYLLDVLPLYPEFAAFQSLLEDPSCAP